MPKRKPPAHHLAHEGRQVQRQRVVHLEQGRHKHAALGHPGLQLTHVIPC